MPETMFESFNIRMYVDGSLVGQDKVFDPDEVGEVMKKIADKLKLAHYALWFGRPDQSEANGGTWFVVGHKESKIHESDIPIQFRARAKSMPSFNIKK